jgi:hypothetical protein
MRRPEPRMQAWMPARETQMVLRQHGSATIYQTEELAKAFRPLNAERAVRATIILHVPKVKVKKRTLNAVARAAAARATALAARKRAVPDG